MLRKWECLSKPPTRPWQDRPWLILGRAVVALLIATAFSLSATEGAERQPITLIAAIPANSPPQFQLNNEQQPSGYGVELINEVAKRAGFRVQYLVEPDWPATIAALAEGKADLIPDLGISDRRKEQFRFSHPIEEFDVGIFTLAETTGINNPGDLTGHTVGVIVGNAGADIMRTRKNIKAIEYPTIEQAIFAILAKEIDAVVYPIPWARHRATLAGVYDKLRLTTVPLATVARAIALAPRHADLVPVINRALQEFQKTDDFKRIQIKWFGALPAVTHTVPIYVAVAITAGILLLSLLFLGMTHYRATLAHNRLLQRNMEEKIKMQDALQQSEKKYREFLRNAQQGIWVIDKNAYTSFVNPAMAKMLGYTVNEMQGKHLFQFMSADQAAMAEKKLRHRRNGIQEQHDFEFSTRDGRTVYTTLETAPFYDENGDYDGAIASVIDITQRRFAEEALRHSEERFRAMVETTVDWIWEADTDGKYTYSSPKVRDLLGYTQAEILHKTLFDTMPPLEAVRFTEVYRRCADSKKPLHNLEYINLHKLGHEVVLEISAAPILDHLDRLCGYRGMNRDITARKRNEEALLEIQFNLAKAQEIAKIGSFVWDLAHNTVHWSDQMYSIYGVEKDRFEADPWAIIGKFTHPEDRERVRSVTENAMLKNLPISLEYRIVHGDGEVRYVRGDGDLFYDESGKPIKRIGTVQDITERKLVEARLLRNNALFAFLAEYNKVTPVLTVKDIVKNTLEFLTAKMDIDGCAIAMFDGFKNGFLMQNSLAKGPYPNDTFIAMKDSVINETMHNKQALYRAEIPQNSVLESDAALREAGIGSEFIVPLWVDYHFLGALHVACRNKNGFSESERQMLQLLGPSLAHTLENARLFDALRQNEAGLARAQRVAGLGSWEWTPSNNHFYASDELYIILGLDRMEFLNYESFISRMQPSDRELFTRDMHDALNNGTNFSREIHFGAGDKDSCIVDAQVEIIPENSAPMRVMGTCLDVTENKLAEEKVRSLNRQIHLLLEATAEGLFGVDDQMRCTFVNRAAAQLLGYEPAEIIGQNMFDLMNARREDGSEFPLEECLIHRAIKENHSFSNSDEMWRCKDKQPIPVQYSVNPIMEDHNVTGAVVVFRNVAETRAMVRKMDFLARHDALTELVNRREFEAELENALEDVRQREHQHVLCYLDLDQFKVVNDTCGHVAGDELLRQVTVLLRQKVRSEDVLARLGGDEFGMLLHRCELKNALSVLESIRETVSNYRFVWEDKTFAISISIGVTVLTHETPSATAALSEADAACYMAKDSGRDRVHVHQADDVELTRRHVEMQWVSRIHDALEKRRLDLYFQAIAPVNIAAVAVNERKIHDHGIHFELLLRMQQKDGTCLPPGAFIPAAERYNLMPLIDRWVISHALQWLRKHRNLVRNMNLCTINISGSSLNDAQFMEFIMNQFNSTGVPPNKIGFEITETAAVANLRQAAAFIGKLKEKGVRFALDDFGSGMSSFAYLKNLPVDFLKIDGNFVKDIVEDPIDFAMVEAINKIGQVMGISTIAEFVENEAIFQELRKIGVNFAQGFGIGMPKPINELLN